jgi:hypothetical protein
MVFGVRGLDPELALAPVAPLDALIDQQIAARRSTRGS